MLGFLDAWTSSLKVLRYPTSDTYMSSYEMPHAGYRPRQSKAEGLGRNKNSVLRPVIYSNHSSHYAIRHRRCISAQAEWKVSAVTQCIAMCINNRPHQNACKNVSSNQTADRALNRVQSDTGGLSDDDEYDPFTFNMRKRKQPRRDDEDMYTADEIVDPTFLNVPGGLSSYDSTEEFELISDKKAQEWVEQQIEAKKLDKEAEEVHGKVPFEETELYKVCLTQYMYCVDVCTRQLQYLMNAKYKAGEGMDGNDARRHPWWNMTQEQMKKAIREMQTMGQALKAMMDACQSREHTSRKASSHDTISLQRPALTIEGKRGYDDDIKVSPELVVLEEELGGSLFRHPN